MTPAQFYERILAPAAQAIGSLSGYFDSPEARCFLLAVAGQESAWTSRIQVPGGQARGLWQCQQSGAVRGVRNGSAGVTLRSVCAQFCIPSDEATIFEAIAWNDTLAYAVARLALWMDPHPLPAIGDEDGAWTVYLRVWRPGKPSRARWATVYSQAVTVING